MAVNETKTQKFEITELVCRGCIGLHNDGHHVKLFAFLRKFIFILDDQQFFAIETTLPEKIAQNIKKLYSLIK